MKAPVEMDMNPYFHSTIEYNNKENLRVNQLTVNRLTLRDRKKEERRIVKGFKIRPSIKEAFEATCRVLGVRECDAIEEAILLWLRHLNPQQTRLNQFTIVQNIQQINIVKNELNILIARAEIAKYLSDVASITPVSNPREVLSSERARLFWVSELPKRIREGVQLLEASEALGLKEESERLRHTITRMKAVLNQLLEVG